ncbi:MAG: TIGR03086 family metal-binding protein [Ornithinimicrobium sp.]
MDHLRSDLQGAFPITGQLISSVAADRWQAPSTCDDWSLRQLGEHLVGGVALTALVLAGDEATARPDVSELSDEDLAPAFTEAGEKVIAVLADPEALQRIVRVGIGPVPGAVAAQLCLVETLVHGWDVAHSSGQKVVFEEEAVARALAFSEAMLGQIPQGRSPFAQATEPAQDASTLDHLVALLGRQAA